MKKSARTISGVTPVAVMTKPLPCPGKCVYCPTFAAAPQSYTPESPAVLRARECGYSAGEQVRLRLRTFSELGHPTDKVELIIMGGTFLASGEDYQQQFIKDCYDALNGEPAADLAAAKRLNETAAHRCVGLCIETRPDWCGPEHIARMLDFGATRVELGVQALDNDIYALVRRGHTVEDVAAATRRLKEAGFKVYYHWMPGLPGATPAKDLAMSRRLFDDPAFRPDGLKLYPTMVVAGTELEKWHQAGRYQPYPPEVMTQLTADIKSMVPKYVRISRVLRDIPSKFISAGLKDSLRDRVRAVMAAQGKQCLCIRCREYGHRVMTGWRVGEPRLRRLDYEASGGHETLLSFEDDDQTLFALLRFRVRPAKTALVREVHVFGPEVPLKQQATAAAQHRGLGKALMAEAERLARDEFRTTSMAVLSGIGAREYYRAEFGYRLAGSYMVKELHAGTAATASYEGQPR